LGETVFGVTVFKEVISMTYMAFQAILPSEVLWEFRGFRLKESDVSRRVQVILTMELLQLDRLSQAESKQILGLDRWEPFEAKERCRLPTIQMSAEEMKGSLIRR
jgi:hypothetical protein